MYISVLFFITTLKEIVAMIAHYREDSLLQPLNHLRSEPDCKYFYFANGRLNQELL